MTKEFLGELEDAYVDQEKSLDSFVNGLITVLCKVAKSCKMDRRIRVNVWEDKEIVPKIIKIRDIRLDDYTLPSDPSWLPKDTDKQDMVFYEVRLGYATMNYLKLSGQIVTLQHREHNESALVHEKGMLQNLKNRSTSPEGIKIHEENDRKERKKREMTTPKCLEHMVYQHVFPHLNDSVMTNISKEFQSEFNEEYAKEEKARSEKIKKKAEAEKQKKDSPAVKKQ